MTTLYTFTVTATDPTGNESAPSNAAIIAQLTPENAGLTDVVLRSPGKALPVDPSGAKDALTIRRTKNFCDTSTSTDITTFTIFTSLTITDISDATDTINGAAQSSLTDTAGATDTTTQSATLTQTYQEQAGATDPTRAALSVQYTDTADATDTLSSTVGQHVSYTEDAGVQDTLSVTVARSITAADTTTATDTTTTSAGYWRTLLEVSASTDTTTALAHTFHAFTEQAGTSDSMSVQYGSPHYLEDAGATDNLQPFIAQRLLVLTDQAGAKDYGYLDGDLIPPYVNTEGSSNAPPPTVPPPGGPALFTADRVAAVLALVTGTDRVVLRPAAATAGDAVMCSEWDLGAPDVRDNTSDRPGSDGTLDYTTFTGARTVTFQLSVFGDRDSSAYAYVRRLANMTHPTARPVLEISRDTPDSFGQTWTMQLRGNPYSITYGKQAAARLDLQLVFTAPDGYLLGPVRQATSAVASKVVPTFFYFPQSWPDDFGTGMAASSPVVPIDVDSPGAVAPVLYIYGPVTNPEVRGGTDERFVFTGLVLSRGEFVQIDMAEGTVLRNGAIDASQYHLVDFTKSTFWQWTAGRHNVRYLAASGQLVVEWRDRRLTI